MMGLHGSPAKAGAAMSPASAMVDRSARGATRIALFLELCHDIGGLALRIVEAFLDEGAGLFFQDFDVELRAARLAEQIAVQESDRDLAAGVGLAQDVLASEQFHRAVGCGLRRRCRDAKASQQHGRCAAERLSFHRAFFPMRGWTMRKLDISSAGDLDLDQGYPVHAIGCEVSSSALR